MFKKNHFTIRNKTCHKGTTDHCPTRGCCSLVSFILRQVSRHKNFRVRSINGVSTAAPSDTEQPPASTSVLPETNEPASQEQARKRATVATASPRSCSSDCTSSSEIPPNQQAAAVIVPSSAGSARRCAVCTVGSLAKLSVPDQDIVTHFTNHPEEDETKYGGKLLRQVTIFYEDTTALAGIMSRVKRIMAMYAANLLIRRS